MKKFGKILVLENDLVLPDVVKDALDIENLPYDVIYNFTNAIRYRRDETLPTILNNKDSLILCYPSFVGYDNTFLGQLFTLKSLKDAGIKWTIGIIFGKSLYNYILKWIDELDSKRSEYIALLKEIIEYFDIFHCSYDDVYVDELPFEQYTKLNFDDIIKNVYKRKDFIKHIPTGEIHQVSMTSYYGKFEEFYVEVYTPENYDENGKLLRNTELKFKLDEIELKIKK